MVEILQARGACLARLRPTRTRGRARSMPRHAMMTNFTIELVQGVEDAIEHVAAARRKAVDTRRCGSLRCRRAKPAALRHARQHRIQGAWTEPIAVMVQFFEHPVAVDALLGGVVEDVDLPEGEKELANDWIAHDRSMIALQIRAEFAALRNGRRCVRKERRLLTSPPPAGAGNELERGSRSHRQQPGHLAGRQGKALAARAGEVEH